MEWTEVRNTKRPSRKHLLCKYPHIITQGLANKIEREYRIDGLAASFGTTEWINYQKEGWKFKEAIRDYTQYEKGTDVIILNIKNKWCCDVAIFEREIISDPDKKYVSSTEILP